MTPRLIEAFFLHMILRCDGDESSSESGHGCSQDTVMDEGSSESTVKRDESESPSPEPVDPVDEEEQEEKPDPIKDEIEREEKEKSEEEERLVEGGFGLAGLPKGAENLSSRERHLLRSVPILFTKYLFALTNRFTRQHELFLTRQVESLPAAHIRGKCTDSFFYSLVYDPEARTMLADKGEIRVGEKYQCVVPDDMAEDALADDNRENGDSIGLVIDEGEEEQPEPTERETLVYHPYHALSDRDIDQFLIVARAVGTFSRALDTSSSMKLPSLHMTAAAASRDVTLFHAMALLHQANYDIGQAVRYLVPPPSKQHYPLDADKTTLHNTVSLGGPVLCRDQIEEWSAAEANLFEEAIEKYGKDFSDVRADYLPWKSIRDIVEYYYMWKTTNRYVEVKKSKTVEQESKLKQVYIPNYNKPNPNLVGPPNPSGQPMKGTSACESCQMEESPQWYAWGPAYLQLRLCGTCWTQWKKFGGLKRVHQYGQLHAVLLLR
ncbi:unnamed protein product [Gongylonema pulchrum]|uniref:Metastasis-associated protein MTA3 n=1 Tax=Gongylonema pulchrum TaxID=637853 RepID=A0A183DN98_9BILA|nr:unnamed protein product [Gongylonema pulchrum]